MTKKNKKGQDPVDEDLKITVQKDGPYLVSGGIPVSDQIIETDSEGYSYKWLQGNSYAVPEEYELCRCGRSQNKPFCDKTHITTNFDGTETASRDLYRNQAKELEGPVLKLTDAEDLCSHARFCLRMGRIWNLTRQSDIPEAATLAIEEGGNCPSGRLVIWDKTSEIAIEPKFRPSIGLVKDPQEGVNGPIWVRGGIPVESAEGTRYEIRNRLTLCRCGKSRNKPFCDGNHRAGIK
jgi:CDGSH-type Zn-finger protein